MTGILVDINHADLPGYVLYSMAELCYIYRMSHTKLNIQFYMELKSPCPSDITCDATTYNTEKQTGDPQQEEKYEPP
jgi:hypothetical protein